jgi:hypothetical protein
MMRGKVYMLSTNFFENIFDPWCKCRIQEIQRHTRDTDSQWYLKIQKRETERNQAYDIIESLDPVLTKATMLLDLLAKKYELMNSIILACIVLDCIVSSNSWL